MHEQEVRLAHTEGILKGISLGGGQTASQKPRLQINDRRGYPAEYPAEYSQYGGGGGAAYGGQRRNRRFSRGDYY
jgi:hypothetical protein